MLLQSERPSSVLRPRVGSGQAVVEAAPHRYNQVEALHYLAVVRVVAVEVSHRRPALL